MMSQAEIWRMQEYCESRNHERENNKTYSIWNIMFLLAGMVLATLSTCLVVYVVKLGIEMTGMMFVAGGGVGIVLGILLMVFSTKIK